MELRHLKIFVAVAQELHFNRAAIKLGMAQPPVSQAIKALEDELGVPLFVRNRRKVELTEAGHALIPEAMEILRKVGGLAAVAQRSANGLVGRLEVAFAGSVPFNEITPRLLGSFRRNYPDVWVSLCEMSTGSQIEALQAGTLDIGFARPAEGRLPAGIEGRSVLREPLLLALPIDNPMACRHSISLTEVSHESFVMHPRPTGSGLYDTIMILCQHAGFEPKVSVEAHQMSTMLSLVGAGLGVAIVPLTMRRIGFTDVSFVAIEDEAAFIDLVVINRENPGPVIRNFLVEVDAYHQNLESASLGN